MSTVLSMLILDPFYVTLGMKYASCNLHNGPVVVRGEMFGGNKLRTYRALKN